MLRRTPLFDAHRRLGAKLVDFSGWEMPLHYGSQIEEHHSVRRSAGMFDVSHMLAIDVSGVDALGFLRILLANNVERLNQPGCALYSCMLNETGGVIDDLIVYFLEQGVWRVVVNAGTADNDMQWIARQIDHRAMRVDVRARRDLAMIAVQGPKAREKFCAATPRMRKESEPIPVFGAIVCGEWLIARTGYTGEDGFEVALPHGDAVQLWDALQEQGVAPAGLGARDTLRLEAGLNLYGQDMDERVTPMQSGLGWTVDLKGDREFIGRVALEAAITENKLTGLVLLERGVLRAHQRVRTPHGEGEITSGSFSPTIGVSIAFARLPIAVQIGDDVEVDVRGRFLRARTVKYPFVRHGQCLITDALS